MGAQEFPIARSQSADQCTDVRFCHVERVGKRAAKTISNERKDLITPIVYPHRSTASKMHVRPSEK